MLRKLFYNLNDLKYLNMAGNQFETVNAQCF